MVLAPIMTLPYRSACASDVSGSTHYFIHGDSADFGFDATDDDISFVLNNHREVKHVEIGSIGGIEAWSGPDPRLFPIKITNRGFAHLANCKKLQTLRLTPSHPLQVTDEGLKSLEELKELSVIELGITPFSSAGLSHLAVLTNVEELWLDFNPQYDDNAMNSIASLKKLRVLRFYEAPITDAGIAKISCLSQLEDLQLGKSLVGDHALNIISGFVKLKTLDLQYTRITDSGMKHLRSLTKLQWLCVKGTSVTSKGLAVLSDMSELTSLYLDDQQTNGLPRDLIKKLKGRIQQR